MKPLSFLVVALTLSSTAAFARTTKIADHIYVAPKVLEMVKADSCAKEAVLASASKIIDQAMEDGVDLPDELIATSIKRYKLINVYLVEMNDAKLLVGVKERGVRQCKVTEASFDKEVTGNR